MHRGRSARGIEERADTAEEKALAKAEAELDTGRAKLAKQAEGLDQRAAEVTRHAEEVAAREAAVARVEESSFGDGLHEVGADIQPGKYRSEVGDTCYWAKQASGDTSNIIDNNISDGPQTVVIDSPFFESSGCGTWVRVG